MIISPAFKNKRFAILGLARSGLATAEALLASGAEIVAWDNRAEARSALEVRAAKLERAEAHEDGLNEVGVSGEAVVSGEAAISDDSSEANPRLRIADPLESDLTGFDGVIVSPGVPINTHPIARHAARYDVPVIGDIELFARARAALPDHRVVAITGTNGKSTSTALIHHLCQAAGLPSAMGGNIGLPIMAQEPLPQGGVYVLELSSYQIDLTQSLDSDIAIILNVTPDHLDRYEGFEQYRASKLHLFAMQSAGNWRIDVSGDAELARLLGEVKTLEGEDTQNLWQIGSGAGTEKGADGDADIGVDIGSDIGADGGADSAGGWPLSTPPPPSLRGPHNTQNALAALQAARLLGLENAEESVASFGGLPHRMELVQTHNGILYVNDSKATNQASAAPALAAFALGEGGGNQAASGQTTATPKRTRGRAAGKAAVKASGKALEKAPGKAAAKAFGKVGRGAHRARIHWIVGGVAKEYGLGECAQYLDYIAAAYTIGEAGPSFAAMLDGIVDVKPSGTVEEAVARASGRAQPGDVILLSPACASFDQFTDFEERGEVFRQSVAQVTQELTELGGVAEAASSGEAQAQAGAAWTAEAAGTGGTAGATGAAGTAGGAGMLRKVHHE